MTVEKKSLVNFLERIDSTVKCCTVKSSKRLFGKDSYVLSVSPRPGGYMKFTEPVKSSISTLRSSVSQTPGDFYSIDSHCSLLSEQSIRSRFSNSEYGLLFPEEKPSSELGSQSSLKGRFSKDNLAEVHSADEGLTMTIGCVMLMASNVDKIEKDYFELTERYLSCIRDEKGNRPHNIKGILDYMRQLRKVQNSTLKIENKLPSGKSANLITAPVKNIQTKTLNTNKNISKSRIPVLSRNISKSKQQESWDNNVITVN